MPPNLEHVTIHTIARDIKPLPRLVDEPRENHEFIGIGHNARPMPELESDEERARNRLQAASRIFYFMAVVKVLELLGAMRPPMPSQAATPAEPREAVLTILFAFYAIMVALCILIGKNLEARKIWARNLAYAFGALHIGAFFLVGFLGPMAIISGVLGIIGFFSVLVASGLGAFEEG